jgi:uncharacterized membrane-anchored protein YjiN (DUF445 family)
MEHALTTDTLSLLTATEEAQDRRLRRMKTLATLLLAAVTAIYIAATAFEPRHVFFGYLAATCEAAMIGALADWFAVVALFRYPLGLRFIPHTAIIPNNRGRIAMNISQFIQLKFLSVPAIQQKIGEINPAAALSAWLLKPANSDMVGDIMARGLSYGLNALDDNRVRHFLQQAISAKVGQLDLARMLADVLDVLTENGRHHVVFDHALVSLDEYLARPSTRAHLAEEISKHLSVLSWVNRTFNIGLDQRAAMKVLDIATQKIGEVRRDPDHELRRRFDRLVADYIARLKEDEAVRAKVHQIRDELLANPTLATYVEDLWAGFKRWVNNDLAAERSLLRDNLTSMAASLGQRFAADVAMRDWINEQITDAVPPFVEKHRTSVGRFIEKQINEWNEDTLVKELERNIGPDLQFIRINGTVVGALAGLLIYSVTQWVHG